MTPPAMKPVKFGLIFFAGLLLLLAGCGHEAAAPRVAAPAPPAPKPALAPIAPTHGQRASYAHIDHYKEDAARLIVSHNGGHTFEGKLPPMLPAIVVLRMSVNADGRVTEVFVQRSRDKEASAVAMASITRAGYLPRPLNLLQGGSRKLSFSETFLFNADYKFQLRSLAPVQ